MLNSTHAPRHRPRHAFTMVEAAVTFFILAGLALTAVAVLRPDGAGNDTAAKASLGIAIEQQVTAVLSSGAPLALDGLRPVGLVDFTTGASTGSELVSVALDGQTFAAAASAGSASCWMVRRDFDPASSTPELWAVASSGSCTANRALDLIAPVDGSGLSRNRPAVLP